MEGNNVLTRRFGGKALKASPTIKFKREVKDIDMIASYFRRDDCLRIWCFDY